MAQEQPSKFGLEAYRDTMCELRRKGHSWRAIADFLVEKGVKTDHTRVYRLMMEGDPLYDYSDCPLVIGGEQFESQKGQPLRPYSSGMVISVEAKLKSIPLEHPEKINSTWCQCQFRLTSAPNLVWLKQLHAELFAEFNPSCPHHLVSVKGFELKFQADTMALDCRSYNLELHFKEVSEGILRATQNFFSDKSRWTALWQKLEERNKKILELYHSPGEAVDEILEGHSEWYSEQAKRLKAQFDALPLHPEVWLPGNAVPPQN